MRWTWWAVAVMVAAALGCEGDMNRMAGGEQGDGDSPGTPLDDGGRVPDVGRDADVFIDGDVDGGLAPDGGDGAVDDGDGAVDGGDGAVDGGDGAVGTDAFTM